MNQFIPEMFQSWQAFQAACVYFGIVILMWKIFS